MIKDFLGQEIKIGDTVVLASRVGNSAYMKLRQVLAVDDTEYNNVKIMSEHQRSGWTSASKLVVVTQIKRL